MVRRKLLVSYVALGGLLGAGPTGAEEAQELSTIEVRTRIENLEGIATAGSEGVVSGQRLAAVPVLRPGEVMEMVPGLIVTQHAGDGKANQYFLRGFNLDHGTDFATWVGGVPVNMPTHAHGQGYTDLNFLIPELIDRISYRKGPYFAEEGDFSSAGSARIDYARRLDGTLTQLTLGGNGYARSLLAGSPELAGGHLLYGLELFHNDGPWQVSEDYRKLNGVLSYNRGTRSDGWSVTGMAYRGRWTSTDQIAQRAIDSGAVDRFGSLDPTTGGRTFRYSLSGEWAQSGAASQSRASVWWLKSGLDLWSNFQYCLNDLAASGNCDTGDQFKQAERRQAGGFAASHTLFGNWGGFAVENAFGLQGRIDRIAPLGLYATSGRQVVSTVREDRVTQKSFGLWYQNQVSWTSWFRSIQGLRADRYDFTVDSDFSANSGRADAHIVTPKLSLIFGPWRRTELYLNYGHGFHSNDARGATMTTDPADRVTPVEAVKPLIRTHGSEIGVRSEILPGWQSTVALWQLDIASELLFVGDAGTTEASRPSRRNGIEWNNLYALNRWLALDADFSWSRARFRDDDPAGNYIPGAVTTTANLGLTLDNLGPWFGALRFRYFGPRPLIEDNSERSKASALTNLRVGYKIDARTRLSLDVYNLFNRKENDIEYYYCSRTAAETAITSTCADDASLTGVSDRHIHPTEPRSLRLTFSHRF